MEFRSYAIGNFVKHLLTSLDYHYLTTARMLTFEMIAYFLSSCSNSSPFDLYKKTSTFVKVRTAHHDNCIHLKLCKNVALTPLKVTNYRSEQEGRGTKLFHF
jgi:hypothetical protein